MNWVVKIFLICAVYPQLLAAQNQGNIWYFGNQAGMDFNTSTPSSLIDGQVGFIASHSEGASAIADSSGALLFYTNGESLWTYEHEIMQNGTGLLGSWSSTQSSLIVPQPNSNTRYYVFTTDGFTSTELLNGVRYSVVDLCLNEGKGAVLADKKNVLMLELASEKLAATLHANGLDYWVIVHKYWSDAFHAFLLTENGIANEVISNVGYVHEDNNPFSLSAAIGQMKISSNGSRIALCLSNRNPTLFEVLDFDNATGTVSNSIQIPTGNLGTIYGIEFSPDNSKLYLGAAQDGLYQVDLSAGGAIDVINSFQLISDSPDLHVFGLQIGPDDKIYAANSGSATLGVVNNPNNLGTSCNYVANQVSLSGRECSYTLPSFVAGFDYAANGICDTGVGIGEGDVTRTTFEVYPNPTNNLLNISLSANQDATGIVVIDMLGREVLRQSFTQQIDVSHLPAGNYVLAVETEEGVLRQKVVIE